MFFLYGATLRRQRVVFLVGMCLLVLSSGTKENPDIDGTVVSETCLGDRRAFDRFRRTCLTPSSRFLSVKRNSHVYDVGRKGDSWTKVESYEECKQRPGCTSSCILGSHCTCWLRMLWKRDAIDFSKLEDMDEFVEMWSKHECKDDIDYDDYSEENEDGDVDNVNDHNVAVCITGQMSRLELETKSMHLLRSLQHERARVTVLFVLYEGTRNGASLAHVRRLEKSPFENLKSVRRFLNRTVGLPESKVEFRFVEPPSAPVVLDAHVRSLDHSWKGVEIQTRRARSHVSQWMLYSECYDAVVASEKRQGLEFDAIVRVREDLYVLGPVKWSSRIRPMLRSGTDVVTPGYETYGGTNDKIAFVARRAARAFLDQPIWWYYFHSDRIWNETSRDSLSPEEILCRYQELGRLTSRTVSRSSLAVKTVGLVDEGNAPAFGVGGRFFREDNLCWLGEYAPI